MVIRFCFETSLFTHGLTFCHQFYCVLLFPDPMILQVPLFDMCCPPFCQSLGLLPTVDVYFHWFPHVHAIQIGVCITTLLTTILHAYVVLKIAMLRHLQLPLLASTPTQSVGSLAVLHKDDILQPQPYPTL